MLNHSTVEIRGLGFQIVVKAPARERVEKVT